jgi:hypothetical protein
MSRANLRVVLTATLLVGALGACARQGASGPLTYYRDVKPIIDAKCGSCHVAGGISPFALTTAADVVQYQSLIKADVASKKMPPWPPDDSCADYQGNRSLTDAESKTITTWIDAGAAVGDPSQQASSALSPPKSAGLSRVDFSLQMAAPYTPVLSPDEYRCFILDWPQTATKFVTGFGVHPGDARIVHHVIAFVATPDEVASFQALDDADPAPGYRCFGGPGGNSTKVAWLGAWAPGGLGSDFPSGTGVKVDPGSKIILQVHYNTLTQKPVPDQSRLDIEVEDSVAKQAFVMPFTNPDWVRNRTMNIAVNDPDAKYSFGVDITNYLSVLTKGVFQDMAPLTVYSAALHMHTRGSHAELSIDHGAAGSECLLKIPKWDFHWQGSYGFQQAKTMSPGDKLTLECHWDNSPRNQPVVNGVQEDSKALNWGETTEDEMCLGIIYVTQ